MGRLSKLRIVDPVLSALALGSSWSPMNSALL